MSLTCGVILAAGRGSRLDPGTGGEVLFSKPLLRLGSKSLLERTVNCCLDTGLEKVFVVTGYGRERVEDEIRSWNRPEVETVFNADWEKANGLSLYACRHVVSGDFVLLMSDHIFDGTILQDLVLLSPAPDSVVLAVDKNIEGIFDIDDATKVCLQGDRIVGIGKELAAYDAIDCGIFRCSPAVFRAIDHVLETESDCSLSQAMDILGSKERFFGFEIGGRWWQDVDTPEMLAQAERLLGLDR